ncbi:fimbrial protein [Achromobacter anxifer]|uniref:fimbrial protein n=1 Tax=Achromobacter anxifer TaxID=1287737 RepID=UPI0015843142|nr:fimbrial protein [Achromobacter anxifer]
MNILQKLLLLSATLLSLTFWANTAVAVTCKNPHWLSVTLPSDIKLNITVADGDVLWSRTLDVRYNPVACQLPIRGTLRLVGIGSEVLPGVYPTGVGGVGYRITTQVSNPACLSGVWPLSCEGTFNPFPAVQTATIELVKTGTIRAGTLDVLLIGKWIINNETITPVATFALYGTTNLKPQEPPTCSFASTGPIQAPLGNVSAQSFKGVGSTSAERPFSIDLTCKPGDGKASIDAYVTLTDATNTGNYSNVLTLSPDSQATGVGIEVLSGTTVLGYGPDSKAAGNINQWLAGTVSAGATSYSIPLKARYVQTEPVVTVGTANARATFTMSYQ